MKSLYSPTFLEVFQDCLEGQVGLVHPLFESSKILGVFGQALSYRVVHDLRQTALRLRRLHLQGPMQVGVEIDCGAFLCRTHDRILPLKRFDVKA